VQEVRVAGPTGGVLARAVGDITMAAREMAVALLMGRHQVTATLRYVALGSRLAHLGGYPFEVRYSEGALVRARVVADVAMSAYGTSVACFQESSPTSLSSWSARRTGKAANHTGCRSLTTTMVRSDRGSVIRNQEARLCRSTRGLRKEGFRCVYVLEGVGEIEAVLAPLVLSRVAEPGSGHG
jgi:hypothetical protein